MPVTVTGEEQGGGDCCGECFRSEHAVLRRDIWREGCALAFALVLVLVLAVVRSASSMTFVEALR
jgi:hypothetical protein